MRQIFPQKTSARIDPNQLLAASHKSWQPLGSVFILQDPFQISQDNAFLSDDSMN